MVAVVIVSTVHLTATDPVDRRLLGRLVDGFGCVDHGDGLTGQAARVCPQDFVPLHTRPATQHHTTLKVPLPATGLLGRRGAGQGEQ